MAADVTTVHRSLDGHRFGLAGSLDLSLPGTSIVEIAVRGRRYELTSGVAALGDDFAEALGMTGFDEELSFAGGQLLIGHTRRYEARSRLVEDLLLAVWRGSRHCLAIQFTGESTAGALGVLRTLRIAEHDDGITVRPQAGDGGEFASVARVVKQVPSLGLLEMSTLDGQRARLPDWQGARTRSGELFTDRLPGGSQYFVLAGRDTWVTVLPLADTVLDQVPALVDRLDLRLISSDGGGGVDVRS